MKVATRGIRHRYGAEVTLNYPDLHFPGGAQAVISGPSGAGKTTLLHMLAGLLVPSEGEVVVGEVALHELGEAARDQYRARTVGYLFQDFHLMSNFTALDNVLLGMGLAGLSGPAAMKTARETLGSLGLEHRMRHTPKQLSTGERQRVALARAVAHRPRVLLADEPTAHLDPERAGEAVTLLRSLAADLGATLVVVSHDPLVTEADFDVRVHVGRARAASPEVTA